MPRSDSFEEGNSSRWRENPTREHPRQNHEQRS